MGTQLIVAASLFALPLFFNTAHASESAAAENLKNFALSHCLYQAFPNSQAGEEAKAAAGGYVETGTLDADAYAEAAELARQFLAKKYASKSGNASLAVMKCIDLSQSTELNAVATRYIQAR
ncbi:hypothetical protein E8K88_11290 [Lampropedia aestuarii]|uniref:Type VI secretion protein n=1 Tax=Lampropedia aestuarii TaxID=2562762 RepID=A0A4S5BNB0_9BURK|nr:T6SS amidase immunity protein Tai4 family protein [Lampropedia aestuarii]THJ32563.1 hypothetical protein E8K88_11290 [Lampropedia aestuarii]